MLWSFIAVLFSGWLYVDASYRGPTWQRWLFKPLTLLLLIALAWQAPMLNVPAYLIVLGLLATIAGDTLLLLPAQRMLYAIGAYFAAHLLYTISFLSTQMTLNLFWPLPLLLAIVSALLVAMLWTRLDTLRLPVCAFIAMTAVMVWVAGGPYFAASTDDNLSLLVGAALLFIGHASWLIYHFRFKFPAHQVILAICYFGGHFLIVRSIYG
ncbi:lysoplasmalogenase [Lonsdalea quercina]|uniref:Uncharacterized membrane protein YhhN n=1 Tax=Lonsdalea quercina TaxID=71657 RepID=A0A1H4EQF1_9GAMM|nr:lysoplasmalogenase [Lonsdalea quercina]SEA86858.1 Uncharacterized membrane protein YhhN [Lonsdalea quercina]